MPIRLSFCGDLCLGLRVRTVIEQHGPDFPYRHLGSALSEADLTIANLECHLSNPAGLGHRNGRMAIAPEQARGLCGSGIKLVNLANNHVMDNGEAGLRATLDALDAWGLPHFGAGHRLSQAENVLYLKHEGLRLAFIGACDFSPHFASDASGGIAPLDEPALLARVREACGQADAVIVSLHADVEFSPHPAPWRIRLSRQLVEAGARLVIQHHPHVVQGVETYRNGLIAYSLGNFVFSVADNAYQSRWPGTREGLLLHVTLDPDTPDAPPSWSITALGIDDTHSPYPLEGEALDGFIARFDTLCSELTHPDTARQGWRTRARAEYLSRLKDAYWDVRRGRVRGALAELACLRRPEYRRIASDLLGMGRMTKAGR